MRSRAGLARLAVAAMTVAASVPVIGAAPAVASGDGPARWDPRIARFVRFVERHRGLEFEHAVPVDFLSEGEFLDELDDDYEDVTDRDRRDARHEASRLHALGLVPAGIDLIGAVEDDEGDTTTGYYDQYDQRMVIRGKSLHDTEVRATLVHELTHALQDQRFDLDALDAAADTDGEAIAETVLVEGDASVVEEDYLASLPRREQDEYYGDDDPVSGPPEPEPATGSAYIDVDSSLPYVLGPAFVDFLESRGRRTRNRVFERTLASDEQVIDPVAFLDRERPRRVPAPDLGEGERRRGGADDLGALDLYLMLAARLDPRDALAAVTGWDGDRFVGFSHGGRTCVRGAVVTSSGTDADELFAAVGRWAANLPPGAATVERISRRSVGLTACESDATTIPDEETLNAALDVLAERWYFYRDLGGYGFEPEERRCIADLAATDPEIVELSYKEEWTDADQARFDELVGDYTLECEGVGRQGIEP